MVQAQLVSASTGSNGLPRRYDPHLIARYYHRRPWKSLWRSLEIIWLFCWFLFRMRWDQWTGQVENRKALRAMQLRQILTYLGPTFIKVGQALSTRPDLVRQDFLEELTLLQDSLPPFPNAEAFAFIETELGQPVDQIYQSISPDPVAAASLGQVYHGFPLEW